MFLADFHIHSNFSDGKLTIPALVDLFGSRGFGAIAITDHLCEEKSFLGKAASYLGHTLLRENFDYYLHVLSEEKVRAWKEYKMVLIPGVELTKNSISNHRSAHVLALGIEKYLAADAEVKDLARAIRKQGGLAIAAHPVSTRKMEKQTFHLWDRREELRYEFDAWEVASGPHLFDEVLHSGLPLIASSDLHHPRQMHSWKSVLHCERTQEAIFSAIRKQEISFQFYQEHSSRILSPNLLTLSSMGTKLLA